MRSALYLMLLAAVTVPGCKCSEDVQPPVAAVTDYKADTLTNPDGTKRIAITQFKPKMVPGGELVLSEIMEKNLKEHLDAHMMAQNDGNFREHLKYYYQPMLDRLSIDTLEKMMRYFAEDFGCRNFMQQFEIARITPIVETEDLYMVSVKMNIVLDVVFTDKYEGDASKLGGEIRSKYPSATYDEAGRKFVVTDPMTLYALTKKDTLDFRFLSEFFVQDSKINDLIRGDDFLKLRQLEDR